MIEHKPRTGGRKKRPVPAGPLDPLQTFTAQYLEWIAAHGFSEDTVNTRRAYPWSGINATPHRLMP